MPAIKLKSYRINHYTLLEMIAVFVLIGILTNAALLFYYKSQKINSQYTEKATQIRAVSTISKYLRNFIHDSGEVSTVATDKVIFKNGSVIAMDNNRLLFTSGNSSQSFALPKGFTATFALEQNPEEPPRIITNLMAPNSQDYLQLHKFTRITACVEGEKR